MREPKAGGLAVGDQVGKPRVVDVAAQVRSFNVAVPKAWDKDKRRDEKKSEGMPGDKPQGGRDDGPGRLRGNGVDSFGSGRSGVQVRTL